MLCIIELLKASTWIKYILGFLFKHRQELKGDTFYYIDTTPWGFRLAKLTTKIFNFQIRALAFRMVDIHEPDGCMTHLYIRHHSLNTIFSKIHSDTLIQQIINDPLFQGTGIDTYICKNIMAYTWNEKGSVFRGIFLIHLASFYSEGRQVYLWLMKRRGPDVLHEYGQQKKVHVCMQNGPASSISMRVAKLFGKPRAQSIFYYLMNQLFKLGQHHLKPDPSEKLMVEYYGNLNLDDPAKISDLFFCHSGAILGKQVVVNFRMPAIPLKPQIQEALEKKRINYIVTHPKASQCYDRAWVHYPKSDAVYYQWKRSYHIDTELGQDLRRLIRDYFLEKDYWSSLFRYSGTKVYVSWSRYDAQHAVITDALREVGGVNVLYQRAYEDLPAPTLRIHTDIYLAYSLANVQMEKDLQSDILYYIATGFLGDYRFKLLKPKSKEIRDGLLKNGAEKIIAYFDEGSVKDERWHTGDRFLQENYAFLLGKVLSCPKLGLILKPKVPMTLAARLGQLAPLLKKTLETGRCVIIGEGDFHSHYSPAWAALAADLAIHGHMAAGSAALESALTGTPTLMLNRERLHKGRLYGLGNKAVFDDWPQLWDALKNFLEGEAPENFGRWGSLLEQLDPFRDGKALERMGGLLRDLLCAYQQKKSRFEAMTYAVERYTQQWGKDKVTQVG